MAEIYDYDVNAVNNNAVPPNGFPENMQYSAVNNSAREVLAVIARYIEAQAAITTTGAAEAYILTVSQNIAAYAKGQHFIFQADRVNPNNPTLSIAASGGATLAALALVDTGGVALPAGAIEANSINLVVCTGTQFMVVGAESSAVIKAKYESNTDTNAFTDDLLTKLVSLNNAVAASETEAGVAELATIAEVLAGTDTTRIITPAGLAGVTATDARRGLAELATPLEVITGTDTERVVTPAGLAARTATEARTGLAQIATQAEVDAGTEPAKFVTPATLPTSVSVPNATTTVRGIAEIATQAEVDAGLDSTRFVTPQSLANTPGFGSGSGGLASITSYRFDNFTSNSDAFIDINNQGSTGPLQVALEALKAYKFELYFDFFGPVASGFAYRLNTTNTLGMRGIQTSDSSNVDTTITTPANRVADVTSLENSGVSFQSSGTALGSTVSVVGAFRTGIQANQSMTLQGRLLAANATAFVVRNAVLVVTLLGDR